MKDRRAVKAEIDRQFKVLGRAVARDSGEAGELFRKGFAEAFRAEMEYRRDLAGAPEAIEFPQTAETVARYTLISWVKNPRRVSSALEASKLRLDCLYGSALGELFEARGASLDLAEEFPIGDPELRGVE